MKAFIPAAGFGLRMGELTKSTPKPLLKIGGVPLIYYSLFQLNRWGVQDCVINLHFHGDQIESELAHFSQINIRFSKEEIILGTAGGIRRAIQYLGEKFLVLNPDSILIADDSVSPDRILQRIDCSERNDSVLGLLPAGPDSAETKLSLNGSQVSFDATAEKGYYYMGYSILRSQSLMHLSPDTFSDLGKVWRTQSAVSRVGGFAYSGFHMDVGSGPAFQIANASRLPHCEMQSWNEFIKGAV